MISDINDFEDGAMLATDVIVVGSGIAGSEVATYLARNGVDVLLLESGRDGFDPAIQALNEVYFSAKRHRRIDPDAPYHRYLPAELRGVSRVRQFGGTSSVWTGKWKHLQPSDLVGRPWVNDSAWPVEFSELLSVYREIAAEYGIGNLEAEAERKPIRELRRTLAESGLKLTSFFWEAEPMRTARRFGDEMRRLCNLRVVLGATVLELGLDKVRERIGTVICRSLQGRSVIASGRSVVLAVGALETARLLLASDRDAPGGIGNAHGLVGRFYTDHLKHHTGVLHPGPLTRRYAGELQYAPKPRYCLCFALDNATQAEHKLLEHVIYFQPIYACRLDRLRRVLRGRPACRDGRGEITAYRVKFVSEQEPQRESRVTLSQATDALGMRRIEVAWTFTDLDRASLPKTLELVEMRFRKADLGIVDFGSDRPSIETMTDAAHQMGTARMGTSPINGVTDCNGRVFGTENLYAAGSATFPTCPSYSPTFTILAMARRLGRHLLAQRSPAAAGVRDHSGEALS